MTDKQSVFKFNDDETVTEYIRRVNQFKIKMSNEKYNLVLKFINELIGLHKDKEYKLRSLTDFRRIKEDDLLKNYVHNIKTINKYIKNFDKVIGIKILPVKIQADPEDKDEADRSILSEESQPDPEDSRYVINVIRRLLAPIQYKLISKRFSSGKYYSIKC